ncbi:MAG: alpha-L-fucosidase [Verrucomicrobia bacterium]|nr:alpha-L-fucosidase [Verrucomicrobiota bacterium]
MRYQRPIIACFLLAACVATYGEAEPKAVFRADETIEQGAERMQWWREAKFGMFVHWGDLCRRRGAVEGAIVSRHASRPGVADVQGGAGWH